MKPDRIKSLIRLVHQQGLLQGDLNGVQQLALAWIMADEQRQALELERERMKYTVLAGNVELYKHLFKDELEDESIPWHTPTTTEEVEALEDEFSQLDEIRVMREAL